MLKELCKHIQHRCNRLQRSRNKRNVGSCWVKSLTSFKLCATTPNNMQQQATGRANGWNLYNPTMLGVVGQPCLVRLYRALGWSYFKSASASLPSKTYLVFNDNIICSKWNQISSNPKLNKPKVANHPYLVRCVEKWKIFLFSTHHVLSSYRAHAS